MGKTVNKRGQLVRWLLTIACVAAGAAYAQTYPAKPVRMLYVLMDGKFDRELAGVL